MYYLMLTTICEDVDTLLISNSQYNYITNNILYNTPIFTPTTSQNIIHYNHNKKHTLYKTPNKLHTKNKSKEHTATNKIRKVPLIIVINIHLKIDKYLLLHYYYNILYVLLLLDG